MHPHTIYNRNYFLLRRLSEHKSDAGDHFHKVALFSPINLEKRFVELNRHVLLDFKLQLKFQKLAPIQ